jgi:hypothetical protein
MNGPKDKNETAIDITQKNKYANKNVSRKCMPEAAEECVMTAVCTCALKCNETIPKCKTERERENFSRLVFIKLGFNITFIVTHVEILSKHKNYAVL